MRLDLTGCGWIFHVIRRSIDLSRVYAAMAMEMSVRQPENLTSDAPKDVPLFAGTTYDSVEGMGRKDDEKWTGSRKWKIVAAVAFVVAIGLLVAVIILVASKRDCLRPPPHARCEAMQRHGNSFFIALCLSLTQRIRLFKECLLRRPLRQRAKALQALVWKQKMSPSVIVCGSVIDTRLIRSGERFPPEDSWGSICSLSLQKYCNDGF